MAGLTKVGNADVWEATNDPGKPVCIGSGGGRLTVNAYFSPKGKLKGVEVFDVIDMRTVALVGKVPKTS